MKIKIDKKMKEEIKILIINLKLNDFMIDDDIKSFIYDSIIESIENKKDDLKRLNIHNL